VCAGRYKHHNSQHCDCGDDRPEPIRGRQAERLRDHATDWVAGTYPAAADTDKIATTPRDRASGRCSRDTAIASGTRPRPMPCKPRPTTSSACRHDSESDDDRLAPVWTVSEPTHERRTDGAHEQSHGQRPLSAPNRHMHVTSDAWDEWRAQRADHRTDQRGEDQDRDKPASIRRVTKCASR
jgi:hypothetical protein